MKEGKGERTNSKNRPQQNDFYFTILELLQQNKTPSQIAKEFNVNQQNISYYLRRLKDLGLVKNKGYGVWEVTTSKRIDLEHTLKRDRKKIRGHAFIWRIKLTKKIDWEKQLIKLKIPYSLIRGYTPRIIIKNRKIWLGKESIVIYDAFSYYGRNAIESRKHSVISFLEIVDTLERKLKHSIGKYVFKPVREHYGMIKNDLAIQCNRKGEKIYVRDDLEGEWLWIDDSHSLGELETGGTKAPTRSMQVQRWWNDNKKHDFKVTSSFLLENMNSLIEDRRYWAKHQKSHVGSIKILGNKTESMGKTIELLADVVKDLSEEMKRLKK